MTALCNGPEPLGFAGKLRQNDMVSDTDKVHLRCSYNRASGSASRNGLLMPVALCGSESDHVVACRWIGTIYSFDDICVDCCEAHYETNKVEDRAAGGRLTHAPRTSGKKIKGRAPKLTPATVRDMRARRKVDPSVTLVGLAEENRVSVTTIHNAIYAMGIYGHGAYAPDDD